MKTVVIMLGGGRRAGKDTAAKILIDQINRMPWAHACRYSYADALRRECDEAFNLDRDNQLRLENPVDFWTNDPILKEAVVRPILIAWGMARRHQDRNYWVREVIDAINFAAVADEGLDEKPHAERLFAVVSDWRFPNELDQMRRAFELVVPVYIHRPSEELTDEEKKHDAAIRAQAMFTIENDGTLDVYQRKLLSLLYADLLHFTGKA